MVSNLLDKMNVPVIIYYICYILIQYICNILEILVMFDILEHNQHSQLLLVFTPVQVMALLTTPNH